MFDKNAIGKFVILPTTKYDDGITVVAVIMGYDFMENSYIARCLKGPYLRYDKVACTEDLVLYDIASINDILDRGIEDEKYYKSVLNCSFDEKLNRDLYENEKQETEKLFNIYREILRQISIYEDYLRCTRRDYEIALYTHHLKKSQRALRRINKRFFYYFGENGVAIQRVLEIYSCYSDIKYADKRIDNNIQAYLDMKSKIEKISEILENFTLKTF